MKIMFRALVPVLALAASVSLAQAQNQNAPQAAPSTLPDQPPGGMPGMMGQGMPMMGGQGGMMGQGMMPMMQGMMGQPGGQAGAGSCPMMAKGSMGAMGGMGMPFERIEGRIAFLEAELGITQDQQDEWSAFADALRANAEAMKAAHEHMMQGDKAASFAESLDHRETVLAARLDAVKRLNAAADPLFAALSEEQQKTASDLLRGSLGMM